MATLIDTVYDAFLKASEDWNNDENYQVYEDLVTKYLGKKKATDRFERTVVTAKLSSRKIEEFGTGYVLKRVPEDNNEVENERPAMDTSGSETTEYIEENEVETGELLAES